MPKNSFVIPIDKFLSISCYQPNPLLLGGKISQGMSLDSCRPLFARYDNAYPNESQEWIKAVNQIYSSPRNIRGIHLTTTETRIRFYKSFAGVERGRTQAIVKNMDSLRIATGNAVNKSLIEYENVFLSNAMAGLPVTTNTDIEITGKAFNSFTRWSLMNLEYFIIGTPLLLAFANNAELTQRLLQMIQAFRVVDWSAASNLPWYADLCKLSGVRTQVNMPNRIYPIPVTALSSCDKSLAFCATFLLNLITRLLNGGKPVHFNSDNTIAEFPRLKFIGFTLDNTVDSDINLAKSKKDNETSLISLSKSDNKVMLGNIPGLFIATGASPLSTALRLNSTYKFDPMLKELSDRLENSKQQGTEKTVVEAVAKKPAKSKEATHPLEIMFNSLEMNAAADMIIARVVAFGEENVLHEFSQFTPQGSQYYTALYQKAKERF